MLLNTTVRRWDGAKCYYPTAMLNAAPLLNLSRSENRVEAFKVHCCGIFTRRGWLDPFF